MAGKSTISITFKLDGDGNGFKNLANDANGFKKALNSTLSEAQKFNAKAINFAAISVGINQASSSINQLMGTLSGLTEGYQNAKQAQTQLVTVMRQRMDASDAEIESINGVIKAQTELGVIGGTVQKRGAQQVATFLTQKSSLETLIPAMNNLIAQQKGLNATQEDAYTVGNLMGKAMQGQTSALRRVGITFTASQEQVMKYGDESQRAAMLSQIITDNVGNMNAELGKTDIGKQKQLENKLAGIKNQIGGVAQAAMPYLSAAANVTMLAANATNAAAAIKLLGAAFISFTVKSKLAAAGMYLYRNAAIAVTATTRVLQAAFTGGAIGATTLKIAIRGLLISTGVGAAIAGLTMLIEYFVNKSDEAAQSADKAADGIDTVAEASKRANDTYNSTQSETYSGLMTKYKELQAAWKNLTDKQSKIAWVKNNQNAFADLGIRVRTVSDAEHAFSKNTQAVVNSFLRRAKAAARLAQLTEEYRTQISLADKIQTANDAANARHHVNTGDVVPGGSHTIQGGYEEVGNDGNWHYTDKGAARANATKWIANSAQDKANRAALKQSQERTKRLESDIAKDAKNTKPLVMPEAKVKTPKTTKDKNKDKIIADAKSYTDLSHNLEVYKKRLEATNPANKKAIDWLNKQIAATEKAAQAAKEAESPLNLQDPKTIEEVDAAIEKQQALRKKATADNIAGYDAEIKRLEGLRKQIDNAGHVDTPVDQVKTYEQLNQELSYYTDALNTATEAERAGIQQRINELNALKKKWDDIQHDLKKPADISQLNTIEDLDEAINYYGDLQKRQSGDEIQNTQRVINALDAKKKALQRGIELPDMQKEAGQIGALKGKEFRLKIRSIGIDELTDKIKDLREQLNDLNNPPTESQRKDIESLIDTYESWRATAAYSFDTLKSGWDGVKGIGDSIENVTSALEGDGDAWQKVTSIIDGFIQIYESISTIVGIINLLTTATTAHTTAKAAEAVATGATATATGVDAAAQTAAAVAAIPVIAANKLATASYMELAAAAYFAAHAYIPFAGFGIAAGFVTAATAMTEAIGVMPFADGGVIYGPTLGLMGEYPGASHNPEVVAPLDKLRGMLKSNSVAVGGKLVARGRELVAVIANETRITSKSGRRTNIKI